MGGTPRYARCRRVLERDGVVAARTTPGGPNRPQEAVVGDPLHLHAFEPTYEGDGVAPAIRYLNETVAQGGWAILVFHDVLPQWRADGDASVTTHNRILAHVAALDVWCAPMGQVFDYVQGHWGRPAPREPTALRCGGRCNHYAKFDVASRRAMAWLARIWHRSTGIALEPGIGDDDLYRDYCRHGGRAILGRRPLAFRGDA